MSVTSLAPCFITTAMTFAMVIGSPMDSRSTYDDYADDYESEEKAVISKAKFKDQSTTVHVAKGSIARLHCRVNFRDQGEQIMWYIKDKTQDEHENLVAMCGVAADVQKGERKNACKISNPKRFDPRFRFTDDGQLLEITHVKAEDENIIYKCGLATTKAPSILINLVVHPPNWTTAAPIQQLQSQEIENLASTGTSDTGSLGATLTENIYLLKMVVFGFLALKLQFVLPL